MMLQRGILFFAGITLSLQAAAVCVVTDDTGQQLSLAKPATRIIVLTPDLVENMFAIGAGKRVIGVINGSDYPEAANKINKVGSYSGVDLERIVTMHPDLIVTWKYAFQRQITALRQFGIPVYVAAPTKLADVPAQMRKLGCLTGEVKQAEIAARQFEGDIGKLSVAVTSKPASVFFQIDRRALFTVNKDSWINQVIELCGGKNIFADARNVSLEVSREAVLSANPDVIMHGDHDDEWKLSWQSWPEVKAVRQKKLFTLNPDWIARAGPRLALGAKQICGYLMAARTATA